MSIIADPIIVEYDDEPDYSKEYEEYEPLPMANDVGLAAAVAEAIEEPEEPEEPEEEEVTAPQANQISLSGADFSSDFV